MAAKSVNPGSLNRVNSVVHATQPFQAVLSVQAALCALNVWVNFCKLTLQQVNVFVIYNLPI
jgi:hypothetical protein